MRWLAPALLLVAVGGGVACGGPPQTGASSTHLTQGEPPRIAKVWAARCGGCHRPVEPGTRDRAKVDAALGRHRQRVHLDEEQWSAMIDFLAPPAPSN
jgi:hypothetical protein